MDLAALIPHAITASIVLLVLGLGLHARWRDALYLFRHPRLLLRSVLAMNVIMPLVAAGLVLALDLPLAVKIALVALAVSPVPPLLPKKEFKAGGDTSYAIGLLVAIAVLSIVSVPLAVSWFSSAFDRAGAISPLKVAKTVLTTVLVPLAIGITLHGWRPAWARRMARPLAVFGLGLLVVSALPLLVGLWPAVRALVGNGTVLAIVTMAVIGLGVGHALGGPDADTRTVLALSTSARHPAVSLGVAVGSGVETQPALAAILLYLVAALLIAVPYVAWRRRESAAAVVAASPRIPH
jgi:BASS family bile acid:Na+ symporter